LFSQQASEPSENFKTDLTSLQEKRMINRQVNAIAGRLSLRPPQRASLEILDRITEIAPPGKDADIAVQLAAIQGEFPSVTDFEREFPSLCFALATGVGKTRLMGAFISYLYLAHGIGNFFVLAPNLTIYNKLIADFTPNTPKYVFKGIAEFAVYPPTVITGDTYESGIGIRQDHRRQPSLPMFAAIVPAAVGFCSKSGALKMLF
jgi:type III restriction enzyme